MPRSKAGPNSPPPTVQAAMDEETLLPIPTTSSDDDDTAAGRRRPMCSSRCGRPARVCLCAYLPPSPLPTSTTVVILHHPHALRRNTNPLSTLPLLSLSLSSLHLLPGRRLLPSSTPLLPPPPCTPVLFLFPSPSSITLSDWANSTPPASRTNPILVLVDGTWKQAKEMAAASFPFLATFATPVCLPCDRTINGDSTYESELILKKEPFKGCMSTLEAVARALRVLEPEGEGAQIEESLIGVLKAMVGFQADHLRPMRPRVKMRKKKELREEEGMRRDGGVS